MITDTNTGIIYLLSAIFFIIGLKMLSNPKTAARGNIFSAIGMLLAVLPTFLTKNLDLTLIFSAIGAGVIIGIFMALKVAMTSMPQFVAILNGLGGGSSFLVAGVAFFLESDKDTLKQLAGIISGFIGAVTFLGSVVAFGKLQGIVGDYKIKGALFLKSILLITCIYLSYLSFGDTSNPYYWYMIAASCLLGFSLVISIGGADMPVVISLLNSYSGIAAAATGFVFNNTILIISGSLVGASGIILTYLMCEAMNRSLTNVLFGGIDSGSSSISKDDIYAGKVKSTTAEDVAIRLGLANKVIFVPGYGMAVAQAQHAVKELSNILDEKDIEMDFAIHPVAGRMPGHMNVLLAEANISYEKMKEMDVVNSEFETADVVIVNGANDVVNPMANESDSPIAGMPILEVEKAKTVIVIKRSLSSGFAGIQNPLFINENTYMLFADGKKAIQDIVVSLKN